MSEPFADRFDLDAKGGLDDVVVNGVECFRLERMSRDSFWLAGYRLDGSREVFWLTGKRIVAEHSHEPPERAL